MVLGLCLFLFQAIGLAVYQVRGSSVVTAAANHSLQLRCHPEADPRRVTSLRRLLLHQVQEALSNTVESHVQDVRPALGSDEGEVNCIL
ncbi:hypothetical protein D3C76_1520310 [compost metagenome]